MKRYFTVFMAVAMMATLFAFGQMNVMADDYTNGLVAHYDFDALSDGVVTDITGNGYDGTYQNVEAGEGKLDGAVNIAGNAGGAWYDNTEKARVLLPAEAFATADDITIAMLISPDFTGIDGNNCTMMTAGKAWDTQDTFINFWLNHNNGGGVGPHMAIQPTTGNRSHLRTSVKVAANEWSWLVYTHTNGVGTFYIDGTQVSSGNMAASFKSIVDQGAGDICIGASVIFPGDNGFGGLVDEVLVYNRALSVAEIGALEDALVTDKVENGNDENQGNENPGDENQGNENQGNENEGAEATPTIPVLGATDKEVLFYTDFSDLTNLVVRQTTVNNWPNHVDDDVIDPVMDADGNMLMRPTQYIDLGADLLEGQDEMIIEFVVKPDAIVNHAAFAGIGANLPNINEADWWVIGMRDDGAVKFGSKSNGIEIGIGDAGKTDGGMLAVGEWVTVKYEITATTVTVYVNGDEVKSWDVTGQKTLAELAEIENAEFIFGKEMRWGDAGFSGTVSEIRVTTTATADDSGDVDDSEDVDDSTDKPVTGDVATVATLLLAGVAALGGLKLRKK